MRRRSRFGVSFLGALCWLVLGCGGDDSLSLPEEGSLEDLRSTVAVLSAQISELESENARLRKQLGKAKVQEAEQPKVKDPWVADHEVAQTTPSPLETPEVPEEPEEDEEESEAISVLNVRGRAVERGVDSWKWAWFLTVKNREQISVVFDATIEFVDASGSVVHSELASGLVVSAGTDMSFSGHATIDLPYGLSVRSVNAQLDRR